MNICEYIIKNGYPYKIIDGKLNQIYGMHLASKGITSLDGFIQNGHLNVNRNKITSLEGFKQNGNLLLCNNELNSLDGFIQNGYLDISYNLITSLEGFKHNGDLDVSHNLITSLEGFTFSNKHSAQIGLWEIYFDCEDKDILHIGCKAKKIDKWRKFFDKGCSYITPNNSTDYRILKMQFDHIYNQFKANK